MRGSDTETITVYHASRRHSRLQDTLDSFGTKGGFEVVSADPQLGTALLRIRKDRRDELIISLAQVGIQISQL